MSPAQAVSISDIGRRHETNEDAAHSDDGRGIDTVADGGRGKAGGEVASKAAVQAARDAAARGRSEHRRPITTPNNESLDDMKACARKDAALPAVGAG